MSGSHRLPFPLRGRPSRNTVSRQRLDCQRSTFILKECTLKPNRNVFLNLTRLFLNKYWTQTEQFVNLTQLEEQPSTKCTFKCHKSRKSRSRKSRGKKVFRSYEWETARVPFSFLRHEFAWSQFVVWRRNVAQQIWQNQQQSTEKKE